MAASRPGSGPVASIDTPGTPSARSRRQTVDGTWRPNTPFNSAAGLKVTMRRSAGLTPDDVLRVPLRFQVPPTGDHRRSYRFNWSTWDTISSGQRARPMGAQLLELQVDTMLLDDLAANASRGVVVWDGAADPQRMLAELRYIAGVDEDRRGPACPFRLVVSQPAIWPDPVVSMVAVLTAIEPNQQAGSLATEYLSATFLQYPDENVKGEQRPRSVEKRTHTLVDRDTLHALATTLLHQASLWQDIAKSNGISGVSPSSASDLAAWAKKHHKTTLVIPKFETRTSGARTP